MKFDVKSYVFDNLPHVSATSTGEIMAECPWCERHGGFYINVKTGNYICFKCEERGHHLVGVVAQVEGIPYEQAKTFILRRVIRKRREGSTCDLLEKIQGLRPHDDQFITTDDRVNVDLPAEFIPVYDEKRKKPWMYPAYLKERGVVRETARQWSLGFCDYGKYAKRVIIPITCPNGKSFTARDVTGESERKILNPPDSGQHKLLMGWPTVTVSEDIALVEGPFDAIKLSQYGIPALALGGKVLHSAQLAMLFLRHPGASVVIMLDPEEVTAPFAIARQLICKIENVSIAKLPTGIDPGAATEEQAHEAHDGAKLYRGDRSGQLTARLGASRTRMSALYSD